MIRLIALLLMGSACGAPAPLLEDGLLAVDAGCAGNYYIAPGDCEMPVSCGDGTRCPPHTPCGSPNCR